MAIMGIFSISDIIISLTLIVNAIALVIFETISWISMKLFSYEN